MKTKTIKTQVVKTVTKRITHPNGFVFNYTLTSINNSNDVFSLESITNLGDNYQYYITPEQQKIIKEIPFNDTRAIFNNSTLARNFASPMIIQRAKEIYTSKNTDMLYPDSLSDFTSTCLILGEIHNPSSYTNLLTTINLDEATTQCLICLTVLELIQNNGEIV